MAEEQRKFGSNIAWKESLQHPLTLFPTAAGILGGVGTALFGTTSVGASLAIGGFAIGIGSLVYNFYLRGDSFIAKAIHESQAKSSQQIEGLIKALKAKVALDQIPEDSIEYATQAVAQLGLLKTKSEAFRALLGQRLNPDEITFGRFLMATDQVHLAVLDNLESIVMKLGSISTIDLKYINDRFDILAGLKKLEPADHEEKQTLQARADLRGQQMSRVNSLLTYNEQALTELAKITAAVTDMRGKKGRANVDLAVTIQELETLAKRAQNI